MNRSIYKVNCHRNSGAWSWHGGDGGDQDGAAKGDQLSVVAADAVPSGSGEGAVSPFVCAKPSSSLRKLQRCVCSRFVLKCFLIIDAVNLTIEKFKSALVSMCNELILYFSTLKTAIFIVIREKFYFSFRALAAIILFITISFDRFEVANANDCRLLYSRCVARVGVSDDMSDGQNKSGYSGLSLPKNPDEFFNNIKYGVLNDIFIDSGLYDDSNIRKFTGGAELDYRDEVNKNNKKLIVSGRIHRLDRVFHYDAEKYKFLEISFVLSGAGGRNDGRGRRYASWVMGALSVDADVTVDTIISVLGTGFRVENSPLTSSSATHALGNKLIIYEFLGHKSTSMLSVTTGPWGNIIQIEINQEGTP